MHIDYWTCHVAFPGSRVTPVETTAVATIVPGPVTATYGLGPPTMNGPPPGALPVAPVSRFRQLTWHVQKTDPLNLLTPGSSGSVVTRMSSVTGPVTSEDPLLVPAKPSKGVKVAAVTGAAEAAGAARIPITRTPADVSAVLTPIFCAVRM